MPTQTANEKQPLRKAGTFAGKITRAEDLTNVNGTPFLRCWVDTAEGWTTADLWKTPKARPLTLRRLAALGVGADALTAPDRLKGVGCKVEVKEQPRRDGKGAWFSAELPLPDLEEIPTEDRAELCRRVNLKDLMEADGVACKPKGKGCWVCKLRPGEKTASCYVWDPNTGKAKGKGWTFHDYGAGEGGDALAYLVDVRGVDYLTAARTMAEACGWWPESLRPADPTAPTPTRTPRLVPVAASEPAPPALTLAEQADAVGLFLRALGEVNPTCLDAAEAYLGGRGCLPAGWPICAAVLRAEDCAPLVDLLKPEADLLTRAGLLKAPEDGKALRLPWWDDVCLLWACWTDYRPAYLVGRRLNWKKGDRAGKYINQPTRAGAERLPVGLDVMLAAAGDRVARSNFPRLDKSGDLLLVEGTLDALGAACLGWPALAMLNRPQAAKDYEDRDTAAARMLTPHLDALRDCRRVVVVPDADKGEKGAEGKALGRRLVAWLRAAGCRAELKTLGDLCPDAPEDCKDLADVAAWKRTQAPATPDPYEAPGDEPDALGPPPCAPGGLQPNEAALVALVQSFFGGEVLAVLPPDEPNQPAAIYEPELEIPA